MEKIEDSFPLYIGEYIYTNGLNEEFGYSIADVYIFEMTDKDWLFKSTNVEDVRDFLDNISYNRDGDKICATFSNFINLQESPAGFGNTEEEARENLFNKQ